MSEIDKLYLTPTEKLKEANKLRREANKHIISIKDQEKRDAIKANRARITKEREAMLSQAKEIEQKSTWAEKGLRINHGTQRTNNNEIHLTTDHKKIFVNDETGKVNTFFYIRGMEVPNFVKSLLSSYDTEALNRYLITQSNT